jgi:hypothetical protein
MTVQIVDDTRSNYTLRDILRESKKEYDNLTYLEHIRQRRERCGMTGVPVVKKAYLIMGFVRFLKGYYIILVTKRQRVAKLLRHSIYTVKDIELVPLFKTTLEKDKEEESKYKNYFK